MYGKDTKKVTYSEFVNRELVLFSNMDNERSLPSLVDGKYHMFCSVVLGLFSMHGLTSGLANLGLSLSREVNLCHVFFAQNFTQPKKFNPS